MVRFFKNSRLFIYSLLLVSFVFSCISDVATAEGEKIRQQPWMSEEYDDYDANVSQYIDTHISKNKRSYIIDLLYSRSEDVLTTLKEIFEADLSEGSFTISQNSKTNSILARFKEGTDYDSIREVFDVIYGLDRQTGQVMIDVLVVELNLSDKDFFDVEYKELFSNVAGTSNSLVSIAVDHGRINASNPDSTTNGFKALITSGSKMKAFINAYQQKGKAAVISSPHIVTANHREAVFKTGEKVPLIESTRPSTNGPINSYKVEEVGLQLKVTPHINRSGDIDMEVYQTIDSITEYDEKNFTARISNREATTNLTLRDGETMVLGGFIEEHTNVNEDKIPVLGNLPLIGKVFKSTNKNKTKTELMVFITPKVIESPEDGRTLTKTMVNRNLKSQSKMVNSYLSLRKQEASPILPNQEVIIDKRSSGWEYTIDKDIVSEIVWRIPVELDVSDLNFEKKGDAPFGFGKARSLFPAFIKTYLKPSEGVIFKRNFTIKEDSDYESYTIKVASKNGAAVYVNNRLVDHDKVMKMVEGHEFKYWNRNVVIPNSYFKKGENQIVVLLDNDEKAFSAYFDIMVLGNKPTNIK